MGWIGVDLDGTLAEYHGWSGGEIGRPVPAMVERVKGWLEEGREVRVFTARASEGRDGEAVKRVRAWCREHLGRELPVTNEKDYDMVELWDDRAVQVVTNEGLPLSEEWLRGAFAKVAAPKVVDRRRVR